MNHESYSCGLLTSTTGRVLIDCKRRTGRVVDIMSTEVRNQTASTTVVDSPAVPHADVAARRPGAAPLSDDSRLAVEIRELVERGEMDEARHRFEGLVVTHQRRALRIAFQYLRDAA